MLAIHFYIRHSQVPRGSYRAENKPHPEAARNLVPQKRRHRNPTERQPEAQVVLAIPKERHGGECAAEGPSRHQSTEGARSVRKLGGKICVWWERETEGLVGQEEVKTKIMERFSPFRFFLFLSFFLLSAALCLCC